MNARIAAFMLTALLVGCGYLYVDAEAEHAINQVTGSAECIDLRSALDG